VLPRAELGGGNVMLAVIEKKRVHIQATVAQQPHAAIGEIDKVHAPNRPANISISDYAPQGWRAVADAGR